MKRTHVFAVAAALTLGVSGAAGQTQSISNGEPLPPRFLLGYTVNGPDQLLGAGAGWLPRSLNGWGVYASFKTDTDSPADEEGYLASLSAEEAEALGDFKRFEEPSHTSWNLVAVRAVSDDLLVYAGGGLTYRTVYGEFLDPTATRTNSGHYWAEYESRDDRLVNLMGGLFFRLGPILVVQFGVESQPAGMTVGVHVGL